MNNPIRSFTFRVYLTGLLLLPIGFFLLHLVMPIIHQNFEKHLLNNVSKRIQKIIETKQISFIDALKSQVSGMSTRHFYDLALINNKKNIYYSSTRMNIAEDLKHIKLGPHPDFNWDKTAIVGKKVNTNQFLLLISRIPVKRSMEQLLNQEEFNPFLNWLRIGTLVGFLIWITILTIFMFFYYKSVSVFIEKIVEKAKRVLAQINSGELSARLDNTQDIVGLKETFNLLMDELQTKINLLKDNELYIKNIVQELTHDLKTPIASIYTIAQNTLESNQELRGIDQLVKEIEYLDNLIDDLFFIAGLKNDPYRDVTKWIDLDNLFLNEIDLAEDDRFQVKLESPRNITMLCNPHLIQRLIKNLISNAKKYGGKELSIHLSKNQGTVKFILIDGGSGFPNQEAIDSFGIKQMNRKKINVKSDNMHSSLGLGSVIIKKIVALYKGDILISNNMVNDKILGAKFEISLQDKQS